MHCTTRLHGLLHSLPCEQLIRRCSSVIVDLFLEFSSHATYNDYVDDDDDDDDFDNDATASSPL